jgi:hypothetical protein
MIRVFLLLLFFHVLLPLQAHTSIINTEDHPEGIVSMSDYIADQPASHLELRNLKREENRYTQFEKKFNKLYQRQKSGHHSISNIHDPVDKWFWVWVLGWGAGILITIISGASIASGFLGILWLSLFMIGSIALVIWLIKKFGK